MNALFFCFAALSMVFSITAEPVSYVVEDVDVPSDCDSIAKPGDHLLIEFTFIFANGTRGPSITEPTQLFHVQLENNDDYAVHSALKGMCKNSTRSVSWEDTTDINFKPLPTFIPPPDERLSITIRLVHVTDPADYQIFTGLAQGNTSWILDLLAEQHGVNAVDEYGQTALMAAVSAQNIAVISGLMNSRRPRVDVNMRKASGFTAVFYAVERASPSILKALLRRGADPNAVIMQPGSKGNTPLHFACMLEKVKQAELLLEYGANPTAKNEFGYTPLDLLPKDAVPSMKLNFRKLFQNANAKLLAESKIDSNDGPRRDL